MSIIYEALQKAQKQREAILQTPIMAKAKPTLNPLRVMAFVITLLTLMVIGLGIIYFLQHHPRKVAKPIVVMKPAPKPIVRTVKVKLNGVFLSNHEKIAMINQQMYHLGDTIEGMKIVNIELESVKLMNTKQALLLHVG